MASLGRSARVSAKKNTLRTNPHPLHPTSDFLTPTYLTLAAAHLGLRSPFCSSLYKVLLTAQAPRSSGPKYNLSKTY
jgi:hypothetical protein